MAAASLVLGIVSLVCSIFSFSFVGLPVGIVGIILSVVAKKSTPKNGLATAGLVCSIIGTVFSAIVFVACAGCSALVGSAL